MNSTQVEVMCVSKKESKNYDLNNPKLTEIELEVPYDQSSIYHKMSGGTNMVLRTVNQAAADMFIIGSKFMMTIEPVSSNISQEQQADIARHPENQAEILKG